MLARFELADHDGLRQAGTFLFLNAQRVTVIDGANSGIVPSPKVPSAASFAETMERHVRVDSLVAAE
jgi:hypothetical protein